MSAAVCTRESAPIHWHLRVKGRHRRWLGTVMLNRSRRSTPGAPRPSTTAQLSGVISSVEITRLLASTPASTARSGMPMLPRPPSPLVIQGTLSCTRSDAAIPRRLVACPRQRQRRESSCPRRFTEHSVLLGSGEIGSRAGRPAAAPLVKPGSYQYATRLMEDTPPRRRTRTARAGQLMQTDTSAPRL